MDVLQTLMDPRGNIDFSAKPYLYIPWKMHVFSLLTKVGGGDLLRDSYIPVRRPNALEAIAAYEQYTRDLQDWEVHQVGNRPRAVRPPTDAQNEASATFTLNRAREGVLFGKCLDIVKSSLTATQLASVSNFLNNGQMDDRWKVLQILRHFTNLYGTDQVQNTNPIKQQMRAISPAVDGKGALRVLGALTFWNDCLRQISPGAAESDQALLNLLFEKLGDPMFDMVLMNINDSQVSFTQAVGMIHRAIALAEQRGQGRSSGTVFNPATMVQQVATSEYDGSHVNQMAASRPSRPGSLDEVPCWNCKSSSQFQFHSRANCQALHCNNCNKCWLSYRDPGYHVFTECPQGSNSRNNQSRGRSASPAPFVRVGANATRGQARGRSPGSVNNRSSGEPREVKRHRAAPFQVAQTMSETDDQANSFHVEDGFPEGYDQDDDEFFDQEFGINMMQAQSGDRGAVIDGTKPSAPERVLQDSGANLTCTPPAIMKIFLS